MMMMMIIIIIIMEVYGPRTVTHSGPRALSLV